MFQASPRTQTGSQEGNENVTLIDLTRPISSQPRAQGPSDAYWQSFGGPMDHVMRKESSDDNLAR
jgi:hypothetical protein